MSERLLQSPLRPMIRDLANRIAKDVAEWQSEGKLVASTRTLIVRPDTTLQYSPDLNLGFGIQPEYKTEEAWDLKSLVDLVEQKIQHSSEFSRLMAATANLNNTTHVIRKSAIQPWILEAVPGIPIKGVLRERRRGRNKRSGVGSNLASAAPARS